jgi:hypothetical protein
MPTERPSWKPLMSSDEPPLESSAEGKPCCPVSPIIATRCKPGYSSLGKERYYASDECNDPGRCA